jgi:hypothetical protein
MIKSGFALEKISTGAELAWWVHVPPTLAVPGELITVDAASAGWEFGDYRIVAKDKEFEDPPPVRRMIEKATVLERLTDAQLDQAMSLMTIRQKERWRMPGKPSIYVDDPELVG